MISLPPPKGLSRPRLNDWKAGMRELPSLREVYAVENPANGESIAVDEAAVWKRVINIRVAHHLQPTSILETHRGKDIGTAFYRYAAPKATICSLDNYDDAHKLKDSFDLIDIDPFGNPWGAIEATTHLLPRARVLMVSNGEAMAISRGLKRGVDVRYRGKGLRMWVLDVYLPKLTRLTRMNVSFFYCFPTTIRTVLAREALPHHLFARCPTWMSWLR